MKRMLNRNDNALFYRTVAILLSVILLVFALYEVLSLLNKNKPEQVLPKPSIEYTDDGNIRDLSTNFLIDNNAPREYGYYNTQVDIDETNRLVSYGTGENEIEFESNYISDLLIDSVKYNGKQIFEKTYFGGDMKADIIDYEYFSVDYGYNSDGNIKSMTVGGDKYEVEHSLQSKSMARRNAPQSAAQTDADNVTDNENEAVYVKLDGDTVYEYKKDEHSRVVYEADYINGVAFGYTYVGDVLTEIKRYRIFDGIAFNYETVDVGVNFDFDFSECKYGYGFNNAKYLTQLNASNKSVYFAYLNDKLTTQITDGVMTEYILDGELKYSGLVYNGVTYFYGYDTLGRINSIFDEFGYEVVRYYFTATGELYGMDGPEASTLGKANSILFDGRGIYDHGKKVYYTANGVYNPQTSSVLNYENGAIEPKKNTLLTADDYLTKSPVNKHTVLHDRVMQIVSDYFARENVEVGYGLYVENSAGDKTGIVDIYTLPYEIAPFSCGNMLNGNQAYDVVYNTETQLKNANAKMSELIDKDSDKYINYFAEYKPLDGTMNINGEFVFLGSLIKYRTVEHGVILYDVLDNDAKNYSGNTNVYDYDNSVYLLFDKPDYELEMFKGVRLIAGINQEYYDNVQDQLDVAQANAQLTIDKINAYEDPDIFNTNDQTNIWDDIDIPEGMTLVFDENGEPHFEEIPEPASGRFWRSVALGVAIVATIVVTTVVTIATVGCGTPIVAAICVGAIEGIAVGFAIGAVTGAAFEIGSALVNDKEIDWDTVCSTSLEFAVDCAVVGGVTGAIAGAGASLGCFVAGTEVSTVSGSVPIEDIQIGDKVLARNDKTGEVEEKEVTNTFAEQTGETVKITADGEEIEATTGHPFYAEHRGYVAASQLRAGDILVDVNGEKRVVEKIQHEILEKPVNVYNLEVADDHNYYVGKTSVLVHNVGNCGIGNLTGKQITALQKYTLVSGQDIATLIKLIYKGVLTWKALYALTNINQLVDAIKAAIDKISREDRDERAVYRFAAISKRGLEKYGPELTLEEITSIICLRHHYYTTFKPNIAQFVNEIIGNTVDLFSPYKDKKVGIYTVHDYDAEALTLEIYKYVCRKHELNYSDFYTRILAKDEHFYHYSQISYFPKRGYQYMHYHVHYKDEYRNNDVSVIYSEYEYNENIWPDHIHIFFGNPIVFNGEFV